MTTGKAALVFGATGQQGGSVAAALRAEGWHVRALVRDLAAEKAKALQSSGVEIIQGDLADATSIEKAMSGVYGVFSVQPSSGQGEVYGVSDEDEVRYGKLVADAAARVGVQHLVYSSVAAVNSAKTGMGHFDSKAEVEEHVRGVGIPYTIVRPTSFMEILMLPGQGLDQGMFFSILRPGQSMQFIAVEDIGRIVAGVFAKPDRYASKTFTIAGDAVTADTLQEKLSRAAGTQITYMRIPDEVLEQNALLGGLARLLDEGPLAGDADLQLLRREFPGLLNMDQWLQGPGNPLLRTALGAQGAELVIR